MATMNVSLPDAMKAWVERQTEIGRYGNASDYVRDLIRRDQRDVVDEERWLRDLDASIERGIEEMEAGGGRDLDEVCEELLADIRVPAAARSR